MEMIKRSYYLPNKLINTFDAECRKYGFVKEKVTAAAILAFMESSPTERADRFERLAKFLGGKKRS